MSRRVKTLTLAAGVAVLVLAGLAGVLYLNPWWTDAIDSWPLAIRGALLLPLLFALFATVLTIVLTIPRLRRPGSPHPVQEIAPVDDIDVELAQMIAEGKP